MSEVTMPRLSDTMEEGTIARWLKHAGDEVKKGDILAEIETDKATMDLEAYQAGILEQILVQEGETVPIGQAVAVIGSGTSGVGYLSPRQDSRLIAPATPAPAPAPTSTSVPSPADVDLSRPSPIYRPTENQPPIPPAPTDGSLGRALKGSQLARSMTEEH